MNKIIFYDISYIQQENVQGKTTSMKQNKENISFEANFPQETYFGVAEHVLNLH